MRFATTSLHIHFTRISYPISDYTINNQQNRKNLSSHTRGIHLVSEIEIIQRIMARITSKSKQLLFKRKKEGLLIPIRLCIVLSMVGVILVMAFLLYQTDRAMFRQKMGSPTDRSMQKNVLLSRHQQLQRSQPNENNVRLKKRTTEGSKRQKEWDGDDKSEKKSTNRRVEFDLTDLKNENTGTITIETLDEWAPLGVKRFWELIDSDFYVQCKMFRVVPNFIAQFGIASLPSEQAKWKHQPIDDDPVTQSNLKYSITFAMSGKNTRTTQLFINMKDNTYLDKQGFTPIGRVIDGMEYIVQINDEYKELPNQGKIVQEGNGYLDREFPRLTYISAIRVLGGNEGGGGDDTGDDDKHHQRKQRQQRKEEEEGEEEESGDDTEQKSKGDDEGDDTEEKKGDDEGEENEGDDGEKAGDDKGN